ncbi:gliding motility lipoprotein GldB [Polaribacter dokdonensis]|uniref:Gliding motility protein GldB n=1 Tax=Polaribacter dokdonensis DSW-5 TaxID=1300348 RepID=A0A0M9CF05_9FLAO|nr:gliding motility lipoprotein GldB [Polaribacter dokdonensis]KOY51192.1 Gliding motility protein GldB [Polaribacter dokdonensis DSW-5]SEE16753.1 protein involved in gliding motility GldB [Polaribacter dokdonensis DSW-5]
MRFYFALLMVLILFFSCSNKNESQIDVSNIKVDYTTKRFDIDFYSANEETLIDVKEEYPYLFPESLSDSLAFSKINDEQERELFSESQLFYKNLDNLEKDLTSLFKHVKYYYPTFKSPKVITMLSNIDYDNRVIYADSLLLISLDAYLGKNHRYYNDFPDYIKETNTEKHISIDVANALIDAQMPSTIQRRFVDKIIDKGKKAYLLDMYLPNVSDAVKMGYTPEKLNWAKTNEEQVWMYFIEKNLLFNTNAKLNQRFIENAPFSKFYTAEDKFTPGRIGVWLGWQIVASYMQHNDVSLQELLKKDPDEIFNKSKYKPKK